MSTKIQFRRDTAANWTSNNPTLAAGEPGFETDTGRVKIGDGSLAWTSLEYLFIGGSSGNMSNMEVKTAGTSWSVPATLQRTGGKWKVTLIGGGGQGGGTSTTAGQTGAGGGSGGLCIGFYTWVAGQTSMTYQVGAAGSGAGTNAAGNSGTDSSTTYNSVTYTAGLGAGGATHSTGVGGAGGTSSGGTINLTGGVGGSGGTMAATSNYQGDGASSPLNFGIGGKMPLTAAGTTGTAGTGYGAGGSGGRNGTGTTARAGGAGTAGVVIIEY